VVLTLGTEEEQNEKIFFRIVKMSSGIEHLFNVCRRELVR
jgi:hypothetical protein